MKLNIFFTSYFWGVLLIILGISALLKALNINIPLFRTFIALIFIYIGISLLLGHNFYINVDDNFTLFSENHYDLLTAENREINVLFGSGIVDISNMELNDESVDIELNTIFASSELRLSRDNPIRIDASSVFASVTMPNGNSISFGEHQYNSGDHEAQGVINLDLSAVFGSIDVVYVD
ncbi:MAG: hypothetical protein ACOCRK_11420 [bacterium]